MWAFATVKFGINYHTQDVSEMKSDMIREDAKLVEDTLEIVANDSLNRLNRFAPQELNNLVWAFCKLGHYDGSVMKLCEGAGGELLRRRRRFSSQVGLNII